MPSPPRKLTGNSAFAIWGNQLLAYVASLRPIPKATNTRTNHTTRGFAVHGKPSGPGSQGGEGFFWL